MSFQVRALLGKSSRLNDVYSKDFDFISMLEGPPSFSSPAELEELSVIVNEQQQSTPARIEMAVADIEMSPDRFVNGLLGPSFMEAEAPQTFRLLRKVAATGTRAAGIAKEHWFRPRPFLVDSRVKTPSGKPLDPAYPSGHAVFAFCTAFILGSVLPERRDELLRRADEYSWGRVLLGVHYPSDISGGRIAGAKQFAFFSQNSIFITDLAVAAKELNTFFQRSDVHL